MRTLTPALLERLAGSNLTLATCMTITCKNGLVVKMTDHDEAIGEYQRGLAFRPMTMESSTNTQVDNTECECLTSAELNREAIEAGLLVDATVATKLVDYTDLSLGPLASRIGFVGETRTDISGLKFTMELVGLADKLSGTITEQYTQTCRASLGDHRCKALPPVLPGVVEAISLDGTVISDSARTEAGNWFAFGLVRFTSGAAAGMAREVIASTNGQFTLVQPMPLRVVAGDSYTLEPGCNRRVETCFSKFNNVINFRGEPYVPDPSKTLRPIS